MVEIKMGHDFLDIQCSGSACVCVNERADLQTYKENRIETLCVYRTTIKQSAKEVTFVAYI